MTFTKIINCTSLPLYIVSGLVDVFWLLNSHKTDHLYLCRGWSLSDRYLIDHPPPPPGGWVIQVTCHIARTWSLPCFITHSFGNINIVRGTRMLTSTTGVWSVKNKGERVWDCLNDTGRRIECAVSFGGFVTARKVATYTYIVHLFGEWINRAEFSNHLLSSEPSFGNMIKDGGFWVRFSWSNLN